MQLSLGVGFCLVILFVQPAAAIYGCRAPFVMNGETMILMDNIGFWNFVRTEKMPDSRFLIQSDSFSFQELLRSSTLPAFTTDLAKIYLKQTPGRIEVPVSDPEGSVTCYLVCRRETAPAFRALFAAL